MKCCIFIVIIVIIATFVLLFYLNLFTLKSEYIDIIIMFLFIIGIYILSYTFFQKKIKLIENFFERKLKKIMFNNYKNKNEIWINIINAIEMTHHTSIIAKIKKLNSEDTINFPRYIPNSNNSYNHDPNKYFHKYDFNSNFLYNIKEFIILFEMIAEKFTHKDIHTYMKTKELKDYKDFINDELKLFKLTYYKFKLCLNLYNFIYLFIPILISLLISWIIDLSIKDTYSYLDFFLGLSILIGIIPLIRLSDTLIHLIVYYMKIYIKNTILIKSFYLMLLSFFFTLLALIGVSYLNKTLNYSNDFGAVFELFVSIMFKKEFNHCLYTMFNSAENIENFLLITKFIMWITTIIVFTNFINYFFKGYDQFYYEQKIKKYLLPPELLKIVSFFLLTVISIAYLYALIASPLKVINQDNSSKYQKLFMQDNNPTKNLNGCINFNSKSISEDNYTIPNDYMLSKLNKLEDDISFKNLLPFSIFLGLLGTLLAISTKDIMENYFIGLSMKINSPYEEGDRIKVENYGMLEVREMGTRSDEFYEITTNSIISIPHKRLSQIDIKNYTKPTLDYREEIVIYIKDKKLEKSNIPREAEKILLMSAFINTGVKLPKIEVEDYIQFKNDLGLNEYLNYCNKYLNGNICKQNNKNDFNEIVNKVWEKIVKQNNDFFKNLFLKDLLQFISNKKDEDIKILIKIPIIAIISAILKYQEEYEKLYIHCDKSGIRRKYKIFKDEYLEIDLDNFSKNLVNISFYYYMLANGLWKLKERQNSLIQKRKIDKAMTQILDVPRVSSSHKFNDGIPYWKVKLLVTLELSEQSDETVHHINMYINMLWDNFLGDRKTT